MALSYLVRNGGAEDGNELELSLENRPLGAVLLDLQSPSFSAVVRGSRAWPLMHIERDIRRTSSLLCTSSGGQVADSSLRAPVRSSTRGKKVEGRCRTPCRGFPS